MPEQLEGLDITREHRIQLSQSWSCSLDPILMLLTAHLQVRCCVSPRTRVLVLT
jgi:hypothetical protein